MTKGSSDDGEALVRGLPLRLQSLFQRGLDMRHSTVCLMNTSHARHRRTMRKAAQCVLAAILLANVAQANTTVIIVGSCSPTDVANVLRGMSDALPAEGQVYLIWSAGSWELLMRQIDRPLTTLAVTSGSQPITLLNAESFAALTAVQQRWALRHELAHLKCRCALGERKY